MRAVINAIESDSYAGDRYNNQPLYKGRKEPRV